jgi:hypothetical protein
MRARVGSGGEATVVLDDVEVVRETELALLCRIGGQRHWVARMQLLAGTDVRHAGDRGRLVLPAWLATERRMA